MDNPRRLLKDSLAALLIVVLLVACLAANWWAAASTSPNPSSTPQWGAPPATSSPAAPSTAAAIQLQPLSAPLADGVYTLNTGSSCLTAPTRYVATMDPFTLATPTTAATQRFQVAYHGGFYTIYDLYSQDYLSVDAETGRVGRVYVARDTPDAQLPVSVRFEVMEVASGGEVVVPVALPSEGLAESAGEVVVAPVSAGGLLGFSFEATSYRPKGDFIVVDKAAQEMACFKGGYKQLESDCATAMPKLHATTPKGTFRILHKQCDRWLSGPSWSVPVKFWVPFTTNGVGFHDASWEKTFGGSSYLTEGSHGCVHMPTKAMAALYKLCFVGERVVVM